MPFGQTETPASQKPLRLWPGVVALVLLWLIRLGVPVVFPESAIFGVIGAVVAGLVIVVWWLFFSRARWSDRLGAIVVMIAGLAATFRVVHESIATGMMGNMLYILAIPVLTSALVAGAVAGRRLSSGPRRATIAGAILLACGAFTLLRTGGITGDGQPDLHWRWTQTPEERLLAQAADERVALPSAPAIAETPEKRLPVQAGDEPTAPAQVPIVAGTPEKRVMAHADAHPPVLSVAPALTKTDAEWPGFRGPDRNDVIRGVRIKTDWVASPPVELWRRPIGPGWSSFAVRGNLIYTQEQRGDDEVVACYNLTTGEPVWRHRDPVRFWESNGGAGPRGTPTLSNDRLYAFGATGILNVLDARNGSVVWSHNAGSDTGVKVPGWGFASSPLVVGDVVVVAVSGALVAYDLATGERRWFNASHGGSYSSPHLVTIVGTPQILLLGGAGVTSVLPADGTVLWEDALPGSPIVQPAVTADGDILISSSDAMGGIGTRRLAVAHGPGGWTVEERWTSRSLKPYFNDYVVHKGHAFGFDGSILACIDLADGQRKWKGGRYGNGQLLLLPDQDVLLVLSEEGELALVAALPDKFTELARFPALDAKTWNHPVMVGDILLVRNGEEMAAFRLSLQGS